MWTNFATGQGEDNKSQHSNEDDGFDDFGDGGSNWADASAWANPVIDTAVNTQIDAKIETDQAIIESQKDANDDKNDKESDDGSDGFGANWASENQFPQQQDNNDGDEQPSWQNEFKADKDINADQIIGGGDYNSEDKTNIVPDWAQTQLFADNNQKHEEKQNSKQDDEEEDGFGWHTGDQNADEEKKDDDEEEDWASSAFQQFNSPQNVEPTDGSNSVLVETQITQNQEEQKQELNQIYDQSSQNQQIDVSNPKVEEKSTPIMNQQQPDSSLNLQIDLVDQDSQVANAVVDLDKVGQSVQVIKETTIPIIDSPKSEGSHDWAKQFVVSDEIPNDIPQTQDDANNLPIQTTDKIIGNSYSDDIYNENVNVEDDKVQTQQVVAQDDEIIDNNVQMLIGNKSKDDDDVKKDEDPDQKDPKENQQIDSNDSYLKEVVKQEDIDNGNDIFQEENISVKQQALIEQNNVLIEKEQMNPIPQPQQNQQETTQIDSTFKPIEPSSFISQNLDELTEQIGQALQFNENDDQEADGDIKVEITDNIDVSNNSNTNQQIHKNDEQLNQIEVKNDQQQNQHKDSIDEEFSWAHQVDQIHSQHDEIILEDNQKQEDVNDSQQVYQEQNQVDITAAKDIDQIETVKQDEEVKTSANDQQNDDKVEAQTQLNDKLKNDTEQDDEENDWTNQMIFGANQKDDDGNLKKQESSNIFDKQESQQDQDDKKDQEEDDDGFGTDWATSTFTDTNNQQTKTDVQVEELTQAAYDIQQNFVDPSQDPAVLLNQLNSVTLQEEEKLQQSDTPNDQNQIQDWTNGVNNLIDDKQDDEDDDGFGTSWATPAFQEPLQQTDIKQDNIDDQAKDLEDNLVVNPTKDDSQNLNFGYQNPWGDDTQQEEDKESNKSDADIPDWARANTDEDKEDSKQGGYQNMKEEESEEDEDNGFEEFEDAAPAQKVDEQKQNIVIQSDTKKQNSDNEEEEEEDNQGWANAFGVDKDKDEDQDGFDDFEDAPVTTQQIEDQKSEEDNNDDNNDGWAGADWAAASFTETKNDSDQKPQPESEQQNNNQSDEEDGFDDFEDASQSPSKETQNANKQQQDDDQQHLQIDEDDFDELEEAPPQVQINTKLNQNQAQNDDNDDEEGFDDFEDAQEGTTTKTVEVTNQLNLKEVSSPIKVSQLNQKDPNKINTLFDIYSSTDQLRDHLQLGIMKIYKDNKASDYLSKTSLTTVKELLPENQKQTNDMTSLTFLRQKDTNLNNQSQPKDQSQIQANLEEIDTFTDKQNKSHKLLILKDIFSAQQQGQSQTLQKSQQKQNGEINTQYDLAVNDPTVKYSLNKKVNRQNEALFSLKFDLGNEVQSVLQPFEKYIKEQSQKGAKWDGGQNMFREQIVKKFKIQLPTKKDVAPTSQQSQQKSSQSQEVNNSQSINQLQQINQVSADSQKGQSNTGNFPNQKSGKQGLQVDPNAVKSQNYQQNPDSVRPSRQGKKTINFIDENIDGNFDEDFDDEDGDRGYDQTSNRQGGINDNNQRQNTGYYSEEEDEEEKKQDAHGGQIDEDLFGTKSINKQQQNQANQENKDFVKDTFAKFGLNMSLYSGGQGADPIASNQTLQDGPKMQGSMGSIPQLPTQQQHKNKKVQAILDMLPDYGFLLDSKLALPQTFFME